MCLRTITVLLAFVFTLESEVTANRLNGAGADGFDLTWFAPFFSGGGYCSEAVAFAAALATVIPEGRFGIRHHGDSFNEEYVDKLPARDQALLLQLETRSNERFELNRMHIVVCHSEPGAWNAPWPRYHTSPCPPYHDSDAPMYRIGRTMFETDRIPHGWSDRLNFMDEVWVPTEFAREIFAAAGVATSKLHVIPEPVDTEFFRPDGKETSSKTSFLFVGKWEERKGLKILLRAFLTEFQAHEDVELVILTSAYHSTNQFFEEIEKFVRAESLAPVERLLSSVVVKSGVPQGDMPQLYRNASAVVSASLSSSLRHPRSLVSLSRLTLSPPSLV
jgi:glycosyltransferase involved in cell wall biosynthesis